MQEKTGFRRRLYIAVGREGVECSWRGLPDFQLCCEVGELFPETEDTGEEKVGGEGKGENESLIILQIFTWSAYIYRIPTLFQYLSVYTKTELFPAHKPSTFWLGETGRKKKKKDDYNLNIM